jgi:hypothetical protein
MKPPLQRYLLAVVLPSGLAIVATLLAAESVWREVSVTSRARVARMVLEAPQQELGHATDSITAAAVPTTSLDPGDPAVIRALSGDTVTGIRASGTVPEVFALLPPRGSDPPGSVRFARAPLQPRSAALVGRASGYVTALYLEGRRRWGTERPPGPQALPKPLPASLDGGAVVSLGGGGDGPPLLAAFAAPSSPSPRSISLPLLPVFGLLLLFATLAARNQMAGASGRRSSGLATSRVMLALVPVLTAGAFQVQVGRMLEERAHHEAATDVARERAAAAALGVLAVSSGPIAVAGLAPAGDDPMDRSAAPGPVERCQRRARVVGFVLGAWLVLVVVTAARRSHPRAQFMRVPSASSDRPRTGAVRAKRGTATRNLSPSGRSNV